MLARLSRNPHSSTELLPLLAEHQVGYDSGDFLLKARNHVAVGVEGDRDVGVSKALTHNLRVDASSGLCRLKRCPGRIDNLGAQ